MGHRHYKLFGHVLLAGFCVFLAAALFHGISFGARPTPPTFKSTEGPYAGSDILIKISTAERSHINLSNPTRTGLASLDAKLGRHRIKNISRIGKVTAKSQTGADAFAWYKVTLDPNRPISSVVQNGVTQYPEIEGMAKELAADPSVAAVSKDYEIHDTLTPNDPYYSSSGTWGQGYGDLWGMHSINAATAWDTTTGSSSVVVAVIDTGLDAANPDISANAVAGWNFVSGNSNTNDDYGHGTHVAGTIAATGNNGIGVVGVTWNTKIMPVKVLDNTGNGLLSNAVAGLDYAADNGAKISNNSWSCGCTTYTAIDDAVKYEHDHGMVTVVAAGNNSANALDYLPSASDGAITVGATDSTNTIASFSNTGERVDVVAPGVDILSLKASGGSICTGAAIIATYYCRLSGTSMATPHVTGLAALMLAHNPALTAEQVRQIIRTTATPLGGSAPNNTYGWGLINAGAAVAASTTPTVLAPEITSPRTRSSLTGTVTFTGNANGSNFASYKIEAAAGRSPSSWTQLATSTIPVTAGTLASVDTSQLQDGEYTFRLTATTTGSVSYEYRIYDVTISNFNLTINTPLNIVARAAGTAVVGTVSTLGDATLGHYTLDWGVGASPSSWSTTGVTLAGSSAVTSGPLGTWDTSSLTDGATYTFRLTAYSSDGTSSSTTQTVAIDSKQLPGWPKYLPGANCSSFCSGGGAIFADLHGDGQQEVIMPSVGNKIYAFYKDGTAVPGWPVTLGAGEYITNPPIAADVDGSLIPSIIVNTVVNYTTRKVYVIRADGTMYPGWPEPTYTAPDDIGDFTPSVADLGNDGRMEIISVDNVGGHTVLNAMHADGTSPAGFPKTLAGVTQPWLELPVSIDDLNHTGQQDIIYATYNQVYVFNPDGSLHTGFPVTLPNFSGNAEAIQGTPAIGDVNGGADEDIVVTAETNGGGANYRLYTYSSSGTLIFGPITGGSPCEYGNIPVLVPSTADLDADGKDEVMSGECGSAIVDNGTSLRATSYFMGQGQLSMADFAGNGSTEFPGSYDAGMQWGNSTLGVYWNNNNFTTLATQHGSYDPFTTGDLTRSGSEDAAAPLIYNSEAYMYLWEMPGTTHPKDEWPMFTHDAARTSHYTVGQITTDTTPPQVVVSGPASASSNTGTVQVTATAIDDVGISKVEFYDGATLIGTSSSYPYSASWTTSQSAIGSHTLTAKAYDTSNNTTTSAGITVNVPDITAPTVPASLHSTSSTDTSVSLGWTASTDNVGVIGYRVYRNGTQITTTVSPGYTDNGRLPLTNYTYSVSAYDLATNDSGQCTGVSMETASDTTAPSAPTGLATTGHTDTSISLSWTASTDDVAMGGYYVLRNGVQVGSTAGTTFTDSGLATITAYTYTVTAYDTSANVSAASSPLVASTMTDTSPPSTPTGLISPSQTDTTIHLSWTAATDDVAVAGYHVYRDGVLIATQSGLTLVDSGLAPLTAYGYAVEAYDAAGNRSTQVTTSFATSADTTPPSIPSSLHSTATGDLSITVAWSASTDDVGVAGYRVYRDGTQIGTTSTTSYTDAGRAPLTLYSYSVSAYDTSANDSGQCLGVPVETTADNNPPTVPGSLATTGLTDTSISLSWNAATDDVAVAGYRLYRNGTQIADTTGTTLTNSSLSPITSYSYTVAAYDTSGNWSFASAPLVVSTLPDITPPSAPTGLVSASQTASTVNLSWTAATDDVAVAGYHVYRDGVLIATQSGLNLVDMGLTPLTTYSYAVESYDGAGNISSQDTLSNVSTFADVTPPSSPQGLLASSITTTGFTLDWSASTDDVAVAGYDVYVNGAKVGTTTGTTYPLTGLTSATIYSVAVAAFDATGNYSLQAFIAAVVTSTVSNPPAIPADLNKDGHVNLYDLSILLSHWGKSGTAGDVNGDGKVDILDLSILLFEYGKY